MTNSRTRRRAEELTTLDSFLDAEGTREAFQAKAVKEVLAWEIEQAMKAKKLTKQRLAIEMKTSRTQVDRLLDPDNGNVTLNTLQRAAEVIGRKLRFELI